MKAATPYRAIKKVVKAAVAIGAGVKDYSQKVKAANVQAENNLRSSFGNSSTNVDAGRVIKEAGRIMKSQNVSLRNSVRSKLGI